MSWENLFLPYANNKGADQPAQSDRRLFIRCLDSVILVIAIYEIPRLQLSSVAAEAGLRLTKSQIPVFS